MNSPRLVTRIHPLTAALALVCALVVGLGAFVVQLRSGPIKADWLRPVIGALVAGGVRDGKASIGHVKLSWFRETGAFGVIVEKLRLIDPEGRPVIVAETVEAGFSSLLPRPPAHLAARNFSVVVSVSGKGRYGLGYTVEAAPGPSPPLGSVLRDLVGPERGDRALSGVRSLTLNHGRVRLRELSGPLDAVIALDDIVWRKIGGRIQARVRATSRYAADQPAAILRVDGAGAVGLRDAWIDVRLTGLRPAKVFPARGPTATISALDAEVQGTGRVAWDLGAGVRDAWVSLRAGQGAVRARGVNQAFRAAVLEARFDPATRTVRAPRIEVDSDRMRLLLSGVLTLIPEDLSRKRPPVVTVALSGPRLYASLAADAPPQDIRDVSLNARLWPRARKLELTSGRGMVAGAPAVVSATVRADRRGLIGLMLHGRVAASVGAEQIFAFWPMGLEAHTRAWLRTAVKGGRFSQASFDIDADPGLLGSSKLPNDALKIGFAFSQAAFEFSHDFPPIELGTGKALVEGNRFSLTLDAGRLGKATLRQGQILIPSFHPATPAAISVRAVGDVADILRVVDSHPARLISGAGFDVGRISGLADVRLDIVQPLSPPVAHDGRHNRLQIAYRGRVADARLRDAALGWNLEKAEVEVEGDQDHVSAEGTGAVGPFAGKIAWRSRWSGDGDHDQSVDLNGRVRAALFGGSKDASTPLAGRFRLAHGGGEGVAHAGVFDGRVRWRGEDGPDALTVIGWGSGRALRAVGTPFSTGLPEKFPIEVRLAREGQVFRGPVRADALSGGLAFSPGAPARVLYALEVTPLEARRLGLGDIPLFDRNRTLRVDASVGSADASARVLVDDRLSFDLGWKDSGDRTLKADLDAGDLALMHLPALLGADGRALLDMSWREAKGTIEGAGVYDGMAFRIQSKSSRGAPQWYIRADLPAKRLHELGAPEQLDLEGQVSAALALAPRDNGALAGRLDLDLNRASLTIDRTDWRKPAGRPGGLSVDFVKTDGGDLRLNRIIGAAETADVSGSGLVAADGRLARLDLDRLRLVGLVDSGLRYARAESGGGTLTVNGRWLDIRRLLYDATAPRSGAAEPQPAGPLKLSVDLDVLRLSEQAALRNVHAEGEWGAPSDRRLDLRASDGKLSLRLSPSAGGLSLVAEAQDAGDLCRALLGVATIKGGQARLTGRLTEGGADLYLDAVNVRVVRAPTMAQILTMASLQGLSDTLNREGVLFSRVVAPVQVRGQRLTIGESRATGRALGLTTMGVADLKAETLDLQGTVAPSYGLNSAIGAVPVLGELLTSRKGEGVVGLGYVAKGSFAKPRVSVNPLSLVTPGILRRMFESSSVTAAAKPADAAASTTR